MRDGEELQKKITDFFPNITASERESMLLLESLFLQQKLVTLTTEKKKKCNEHTDVRAPESTGVNPELALPSVRCQVCREKARPCHPN